MKHNKRGVVFPDYKTIIVTTILFVLKPAVGVIASAVMILLKYLKKA